MPLKIFISILYILFLYTFTCQLKKYIDPYLSIGDYLEIIDQLDNNNHEDNVHEDNIQHSEEEI